jgi:hypothetical protein
LLSTNGGKQSVPMEVIEISRYGFQARARSPLPLNAWCDTTVQLGRADVAHFRSLALRENGNGSNGYYAFRLGEPDVHWGKFVSALHRSTTYSDLESAVLFVQ